MGKVVDPDCTYGYPGYQLEEMLGDRFAEFCEWMNGQTMMICDGTRHDPDTGGRLSDGGPHGIIAYPWDVDRFLAGQPIID